MEWIRHRLQTFVALISIAALCYFALTQSLIMRLTSVITAKYEDFTRFSGKLAGAEFCDQITRQVPLTALVPAPVSCRW